MKFSKIGLFAFAACAIAQADIKGSIVDESGNPVHNAAVTTRTLPNLLSNMRALSNEKGAFTLPNAKKGQSIVVRKTGFLPATLSVIPGKKNYGNIALKRDPIENRIDSLMANMSIDDMIAQMTQAKAPATTCGGKVCGSALEGGGAYTADFYTKAWNHKIPVIYGKDNVHGVADVNGATIFPHNIGLGATRDSALVRRIGQAVAEEMWAAHIDLNFAPAIAVPQDERWGRVYEGFGETTELAVDLGAAFVRGQQGDNNNAEWRVITTLKHFIGDGATDKGFDRGNAKITNKALHAKYLPPYEAAIEQGALSVMASFNQVNGIHQHVDSALLTGVLKTELAFDGYVIADWEGIESSTTPGAAGDYSPGLVTGISSKEAIRNSINAGLDMAMVPQSAEAFVSNMKELVASGEISEERVKDATRRILRAKIRAGRIDNPNGPSAYVGVTSNIGSAAHRQLAREAVQKSLVILKNKKVLPLATNDKIFVTGSHANNTGLQCGAWTQGWQGTMENVPGATSIQAGFDEVAKGTRVATAEEAGTIVYVIGEVPFAEWFGDYRGDNFNNKIITKKERTDMSFNSTDEYIAQIKEWQKAGHKVAVVLITGRPLPITSLINVADAFVVAWLPGSEGAGVADVLFGKVKPTGKLPHTWPKDAKQIPINVGDGKKGLYPYGFGLTY